MTRASVVTLEKLLAAVSPQAGLPSMTTPIVRADVICIWHRMCTCVLGNTVDRRPYPALHVGFFRIIQPALKASNTEVQHEWSAC